MEMENFQEARILQNKYKLTHRNVILGEKGDSKKNRSLQTKRKAVQRIMAI
jgi:hypothetical protein